jgi:hypothetical protein
MIIDDSGNWNWFINMYFIHLASLIHPFSSCREYRYDIPQITARFFPCAGGGGGCPHGPVGAGGCATPWGGGGGTLRGSATWVTAWQMAHRIEVAPCGSCSGVRQPEQFISISMVDPTNFSSLPLLFSSGF